ncbi:MAG: hypothetical protein LBG60_14665, partial [Bifidobacteriaceae bacterium]|nr:hypothetical protein [Bifidobacteriaceae bacterium]
RSLLLFGQEGPGLSAEAVARAEAVYEITQYGSTRSINAGAAAAIAMYHWALHHATGGAAGPAEGEAAASDGGAEGWTTASGGAAGGAQPSMGT